MGRVKTGMMMANKYPANIINVKRILLNKVIPEPVVDVYSQSPLMLRGALCSAVGRIKTNDDDGK